MSKVEELAIKINTLLLEEPLIQSFQENQEHLNTLPIGNLEEELKELQKRIVSARHHDSDEVVVLEEIYKQKMDAFINHPIIANYLYEKEEVNQKLQEIIHMIQSNLEI